MALRTSEEYVASIKNRNPVPIWFNGVKIEDPTEEPLLAPSLATIKKVYDLALHPEMGKLFSTDSKLTNDKINFYVAPLMSREDAVQKSRMARASCEIFGGCTFRCTGSEAICGLYPFTWELEQDTGADYHQRFLKWLTHVHTHDLAVTAALTDPKGNRRVRPHEQAVDDAYLRIVKEDEEGIVIRGAKINQTGIVFANEVVILPTSAFTAEGEEYVVACAIPADAPGVTYVIGRTPNDLRIIEGKGDMSDVGKKYSDHQAMIILEDVAVPRDRVFICRNWEKSGQFLEFFTAVHRLTAGSCKAGGLSLLLGAATVAADHLGAAKISHIKGKLSEMAINAETLYALSLAAGYEGFEHPSGAWIPNSLLAHSAKFQATKLPFEQMRIAREIMSGWGETAPSLKDLSHPEIGPKIDRFFKPDKEDVSSEDRLKILRLIEALARGSNFSAMALHGGGNTEACRLMALRHIDFQKVMEMAETISGVKDDDEPLLKKIADRDGKIDQGPLGLGLKKS
jgi:4-hydroxybutyryl-CoA dehydratase/vinylacetyl-CoA-Delta-isomerase